MPEAEGRCADCPERKSSVTDDAIRWHLSGRDDAGRDFVMGVYPMLLDETCFFLAADFDKAAWQEDARAVLETCRRLGAPAALERSRSGKGGHVWLFFDEAIPAALARRLGSHILTETMEFRPDMGLDSYDRFFPNQDTMPQGGFGNLIALPLQKQPRDRGNSAFLDDSGAAYPDQWAFLSTVKKIDRPAVERIAHDAERRGRIVGVRMVSVDDEDAAPWTAPPSRRRKEPPIAGPLPERLELILGDQVYIAKDRLPPGLRNRLVRLAAFQNPEFYKAQAMRLPTYGKPRIIGCAEDLAHHIGLPRGCLEDVEKLLSDLGIAVAVHDERNAGSPLETKFHGELLPEQKIAARAMLAHETGVLCATTAFGKTVIAAWLIAQRGVNTLVLVHRRQLLEQWVERLAAFLNLPPKAIGRIGGGHRKLTGSLDVALIQSLVRKGVVQDCVGDYGQLIVDECHHLSARSFEQVARRAKARFVTGLSATVARKDGHHPIIFMQCGPIRYRVDARQQAAARPFTHQVIVRPTGFRSPFAPDEDSRIEFQKLQEALAQCDSRNRMICEDVLEALRNGRSPLVDRAATSISTTWPGGFCPASATSSCFAAGAAQEARRSPRDLRRFPRTRSRVLLATGRYIGEGFDDARLDTLFLTLPVSWRWDDRAVCRPVAPAQSPQARGPGV